MNDLAGTGRLLSLALRRDRVQLPVWIASLTALHAFSVQAMVALYGTEAERASMARGVAVSGVALMFNGLVSGADLGTLTMSQTLLVMIIGSALMSTFCVVRHTRQDEETGRTELVVASAVGRQAPLAAALVIVTIANVVLGLLNVVVLAAFGLPWSGSLAAGASIGSVGLAFGALAAVAAQLATTSRAANGLAGAAVAVAFAARGIGDMASSVDRTGVRVISSWPSWLTPMGWGQQVRPYDDDNWLLVGAVIAFAVVASFAAFLLLEHRDVGSGMLATRPGPATAGRSLAGPFGLAWRLQRNVFVGWAVAMVVLGLAFGAMSQEIDDLVGSSDATIDILEGFGGAGSLEDVYLAATIAMAGLGAAAYTVQAATRVVHEEATGTADTILAAAVSRTRWLASHATIAALGTVALLLIMGACTGVAHGAVGGGGVVRQTATYARAGVLQAPAAMVLGALAVMLFGLAPRRARVVAWCAYAACIALGQMGELLRLPAAVLDLSPFTHLAAAPVEPAALIPSMVLLVVSGALVAAGVAGFERRDVGSA